MASWDGHKNEMTGFVDLPFRVDRIMISQTSYFSIFLSGRQLLLAGIDPSSITVLPSGLLPELWDCDTPTPLRFPERVKGILYAFDTLCWVTDGSSHCCYEDVQFTVPFESVAISDNDKFLSLTGQWFVPDGVFSGVANMIECEAPVTQERIIPVDIDPWTQESER